MFLGHKRREKGTTTPASRDSGYNMVLKSYKSFNFPNGYMSIL